MIRCNSCGGKYPEQAEGAVTYIHVCPEQIIDTPEVVDPNTHEIIKPTTRKATPNPRNENRIYDHVWKEARMVSEGSGVTKEE